MPSLPRRSRAFRAPRLAAVTVAWLAFVAAPSADLRGVAAASAETRTAQPARAQQSLQPQYTIQARVPLTIVDVTVTDAKGNPVHGLKQSDFTILEDKQEMKPNSFEEHRTDEAAAPTAIRADLNLPPDTFTNETPASSTPASRPINILLIDNLNTPTQVQQKVQQQMLAYLKRMPPGTPMAVLGLTYRPFIIQGVTTDPELLKTAIASQKNIYITPPLQDSGQDSAAAEPSAKIIASLGAAQLAECQNVVSRGMYTISAMKQIARYLSGMPGRKNLIWFTSSFPPDTCYDFTDELNAVTAQLAQAHVVINPIDGRGLRTENHKLLDEHYNMDLRAEQTGGHAVYSSNDLAGAVADAIDLGSNFYTLTYAPTNQTLDARFRTITVKVNQPNLHLDYRNGYYAVDPTVDARGKPIETVSPMQSALMRGALDATQILFKVKATEAPATETTLAAGNIPDPRQMHAPYRRISISYSIDVHGIAFSPSPDGNYRGGFEYGVRVYNAAGDEIVNSAVKTVDPILLPSVYRSMLAGGANAHQEIDVPAKGDYFLRIAVHDLNSNHVGALEIPTASVTPEKP
jgi:VWFA-related protein